MAAAEAGGDAWLRDYYEDTSGYPAMFPNDEGRSSYRKMAEGRAAFVGDPDDVAAGIEFLLEITGGFGSMLILENGAASVDDRRRSYELFAREVAPRFNGLHAPLLAAQQRSAAGRRTGYDKKVQAQTKAHVDYFGGAGDGEKGSSSA